MLAKPSQNGFTILELLIVLVIVFLIAALSTVAIDSAKTNLTMQNVAKELKASLESARTDSMKRRPITLAEMAKVTIKDTESFSVSVDLNYNGVLDAPETRIIDLGHQDSIRIFKSDLELPVTIFFDKRGRARAYDKFGTVVNALFTICDDGCETTAPRAEDSRKIWVSPAGTVALLYGGESHETATSPNVTTVATSSNIKPTASTAGSNNGSLVDVLFGGGGN